MTRGFQLIWCAVFIASFTGGSANEFGASDIRNQKKNAPIKTSEAEEDW